MDLVENTQTASDNTFCLTLPMNQLVMEAVGSLNSLHIHSKAHRNII
jgi:hypothetical protein